ncbi:hypothetical protein DEO72_LG7g1510 [Vigna unguiculata]|uniref:Uncharacterized protein n=1 Tax=Vigna unguiculata TaxID=3917 RepID=A0A4D6MI59_VIGUN|nr:hypothetical protein DEO72_LG7g1510 [Vigna unguiculata]
MKSLQKGFITKSARHSQFKGTSVICSGFLHLTLEAATCEEEQNNPVSVLQVGEDEFSPFD